MMSVKVQSVGMLNLWLGRTIRSGGYSGVFGLGVESNGESGECWEAGADGVSDCIGVMDRSGLGIGGRDRRGRVFVAGLSLRRISSGFPGVWGVGNPLCSFEGGMLRGGKFRSWVLVCGVLVLGTVDTCLCWV